MPVPEPDVAGGEVPPAKDFTDEPGWYTFFDLSNDDDSAGSLPVLLYHEHLDTLSKLNRERRQDGDRGIRRADAVPSLD